MQPHALGRWSPIANLFLVGVWAAFGLGMTCLLLFEAANRLFHFDNGPGLTETEVWRISGMVLLFAALAGVGFLRMSRPNAVIVWAYRIACVAWVGSLVVRLLIS